MVIEAKMVPSCNNEELLQKQNKKKAMIQITTKIESIVPLITSNFFWKLYPTPPRTSYANVKDVHVLNSPLARPRPPWLLSLITVKLSHRASQIWTSRLYQ